MPIGMCLRELGGVGAVPGSGCLFWDCLCPAGGTLEAGLGQDRPWDGTSTQDPGRDGKRAACRLQELLIGVVKLCLSSS